MSHGANSEAAIRVGIVGFGGQGKLHFESIWNTPPFEVVWIFDRDPQRTTGLPNALHVRSFKDALNRDTQIVVVATPPSSHFSIAQSFLLAGKNLLLEKPTALSYSETRRLLEMAQRRQLFVLTHFNRRWDPDFLTIRRALNTYDFGRVHEIGSRVSDVYALSQSYPGRKRWKFRYPGGGILLDWAPHLFDQLFELMGLRRPNSVYCHTDRPNCIVDPRLEEQFTIQVRYCNCLAVLGASWNAGFPLPRWLVCGTRAAIIVDKIGEGKGTIRFRRGDQVLTQQVDAEHILSAAEAMRTLVQLSVQRRKTSLNEARRMRMVSYAVDLARRSYLIGKPLAWKL